MTKDLIDSFFDADEGPAPVTREAKMLAKVTHGDVQEVAVEMENKAGEYAGAAIAFGLTLAKKAGKSSMAGFSSGVISEIGVEEVLDPKDPRKPVRRGMVVGLCMIVLGETPEWGKLTSAELEEYTNKLKALLPFKTEIASISGLAAAFGKVSKED